MVGTRKLGSQGFQASELGLGCMSLTDGFYKRGEGFDDETGLEVLKKAFDLGISLLNTADFYGPETNELLIGRAIKGLPRDKVVISSKWGPTITDGQMGYNATKEDARKSIEGSLKRLGVDYLDLWILRGNGPGGVRDGFEETIQAMSDIVKEGKVKYIGLSEIAPDNIRRAHKIHPVTAIEMEWSLFSRDAEKDIVPVARELGIGFLAYAPLGRGLLTGNLPKPEDLPEGDFRRHEPRFSEQAYAKNVALVAKLEDLAKKKGCSTGQLALAWVQHQGDDVIPIPGTKRVKYLEQNVAALDVKLTRQELQELEEAVPHSQVVGSRYPEGHNAAYNH